MGIYIDDMEFDGVLEGPWPEDPVRGYKRQGSTHLTIPSLSAGGKTLHVDLGCDESSGTITVSLQYITRENLLSLWDKYKATGPTNVSVGDDYGNEWICVFAPATNACSFEQHPGFPGYYKGTIEFNIVSQSEVGS